MEKKNTAWSRIEKFLDGKGFYIVLFACIAVIGVSAGVLIINENSGEAADVVSVVAPDTNNDVFKDSDASVDGRAPTVSEPANPDEQDTAVTPSKDKSSEASPDEPENTEKTLIYIWPVVGEIEVGYYSDELVYNKTMADWRTHGGVDITSDIGTQVKAVADGTVESVCDDDMLGITVTIDHGGGIKSIYSNMAGTPTVSEGDSVAMGSVIGSVGDTAISETSEVQHLHFAMTKDGSTVDPTVYLPQRQ